MTRIGWSASLGARWLAGVGILLLLGGGCGDGASDSPPTSSFEQARALLGEARFEEAEQALRRHLEKHPESRRAREELKWLYFNLLRRREVEEFLEKCLTATPHDYSLLVSLLYTEIRQQTPQEALKTLQRVNQTEPGQPSVLLALGYCYWKLGHVEQASQHLEAALRRRPQHPETIFTASEFLLEQNRLEAARELLLPENGLSEEKPLRSLDGHHRKLARDDRWWWLLSRLARIEGKHATALERIEQALRRRPFELKYVQSRAELLQAMGRPRKATQAFQRARKLQSCRRQLYKIVMSDALQEPTPEICREVAELCAQRGRRKQAAGWRFFAERLAERKAS